MRLLIFLLLLPLTAFGQSARKVGIECRALFPFEPMSGRYVAGSLSQVAEYVAQWRAVDSISLTLSPQLTIGYRIYEELVDSTLSTRVFSYFSPVAIDSVVSAVDFTGMPHSRDFTTRFDDDIQRIKRFFATPIASLSDTLFIDDSYYGVSAFASLFHRFQLAASGADVSFFAPPAENGFLKKELYVKDIYSLFRFNNDLVICEMTGRQIKDYIQKTYAKRYYTMRNENSDLVRRRTPYYMHTSVAGASFRVNLTNGRIEDFSLPLDSTFKVVMNSFEAGKIGTYNNLGDYRITLLKWLMSQDVINSEIIECWTLSPERWVHNAAKREREYYLRHMDL